MALANKIAQQPDDNAARAPMATAAPAPALGTPLRILALVRSVEVRSALTDAVGGLGGTRLDVRIGQLAALDPRALAAERADVLLFDVDADDPQEMAVLHRIREEHAGRKAILATAARLSAAGARRLVRDGVDDFIPQPLERAEVLEALDIAARKLLQIRAATAPRGRVLAFLKACGGVGATTLAVQTALSLRQRGRKAAGAAAAEVCLLDLDLQFGTAALYLDLESKLEIVDIIRQPERVDGELLRGAMSQHAASGLSVLTAPSAPVPLEALTPETAARLIDLARDEFDHVVVDLPHALVTWLEPVLSKADLVVLVTQLTVPAIRQARRLIDIMHDEGLYDLPLAVALNRYSWRWGQGVRLKQAQEALGRPFDFLIPNDYDLVVDAINQGVPLHEIRRRNKVTKRVRLVAEACLERIARREREAAAVASPPRTTPA